MSEKVIIEQSGQEEQSVVVLSIGHAHTLAEGASFERDYKKLQQIANAVLNGVNMYGKAAEYHNLGAEFARQDDYFTAYSMIVNKGLVQYPNDIDLLADAIHYGSCCGKNDECERLKDRLMARPRGAWNWRAFTFLIDYLKEQAEQAPTGKNMEILDEALKLCKEYQQVLPLEEKGYIAEAEVRKLRQQYMRASDDHAVAKKAKDEDIAAKEVLKTALGRSKENPAKIVAVQCALCYADMLFEEQEYEETISVCQQALAYVETQPSARIAYFKYLSALCKEALLRGEARKPGNENALRNQKAVAEVLNEFRVVNKIIGEPTYQKNIRNRAELLSAESGVPLPKDFDNGSPNLASLLAQMGAGR